MRAGLDPARGFGERPLFGDDDAEAAGADGAHPLRLLMVCTANISRSPYAELRAAQLLDGVCAAAGQPGVTVSSAGVPGYTDRPMDTEMRERALEAGVPAQVCDSHLSRPLTLALIDGADLLLTMEKRHRNAVLDLHPQAFRKVLTLAQAAQAAGRLEESGAPESLDAAGFVRALVDAAPPATGRLDVPDPYRRGEEVSRRVARLIDGYLVTISSLTSRVLTPLVTVQDGVVRDAAALRTTSPEKNESR